MLYLRSLNYQVGNNSQLLNLYNKIHLSNMVPRLFLGAVAEGFKVLTAVPWPLMV